MCNLAQMCVSLMGTSQKEMGVQKTFSEVVDRGKGLFRTRIDDVPINLIQCCYYYIPKLMNYRSI